MNLVFHISEDGSEIEFVKPPKLVSQMLCNSAQDESQTFKEKYREHLEKNI